MLGAEGGRTSANRKAAYAAIKTLLKTPARADTNFEAVGLKVPK